MIQEQPPSGNSTEWKALIWGPWPISCHHQCCSIPVSLAVYSCLLCTVLYILPWKLLLLEAVIKSEQFSLPAPLSIVSLNYSCHSLTRSQTLPAIAWLWTSQDKFPENRKAEMRIAAHTGSTSQEQQPDEHPGDPWHDLSHLLSAAPYCRSL